MNKQKETVPQTIGKLFAYILISLIAISILAVVFKLLTMLLVWLFL